MIVDVTLGHSEEHGCLVSHNASAFILFLRILYIIHLNFKYISFIILYIIRFQMASRFLADCFSSFATACACICQSDMTSSETSVRPNAIRALALYRWLKASEVLDPQVDLASAARPCTWAVLKASAWGTTLAELPLPLSTLSQPASCLPSCTLRGRW